MSREYLKQYDDFIEILYKIHHLKSNESFEEIFNLINRIMISKYKVPLSNIIYSISTAILCNYGSIELYTKILQQFLSTNPSCASEIRIIDTTMNLHIIEGKDIKFKTNLFPEENQIFFIIMNDQIEKFKEYITQNSLEDISIQVPCINNLSPIESSSYFGSVNIFTFLYSCLNCEITQKCLQLSFLGGNTDIINECLKHNQLDIKCLEYIVLSHNHSFAEYIFQRDIFKPKDFNEDSIITAITNSLNLKVLLLLFEKDKNSVIPWIAAFPQALEILKDKSIDLTKVSNINSNLLHYAATSNNFELCKFLLNENKIDFDTEDNNERTPLHYCALYDSKETAEVLISHGADINKKDFDGCIPLHHAIILNFIEVAKLLISKGSDINSVNIIRRTALHEATIRSNKDAVELLVSHGADINLKDIYGLTPLQFAIREKNLEIVGYLVNHGANIHIH